MSTNPCRLRASGPRLLAALIQNRNSKFKNQNSPDPFSRVFKSYQGFSRDNLSSPPLSSRLQARGKSEIKNQKSMTPDFDPVMVDSAPAVPTAFKPRRRRG